MKHRRDIDGLRAVAVLPIVLFHFGVTAIPGGFTGVDIFFVISGYLISGNLKADLDAGRFSLVDFYWRRARRILPALMAVTALSTVAALLILLPGDLVDFLKSAIASSTFWSNLYFWKETNYFSVDAQLRPLLHTWSLAVEEQYYIFAPFLILVIHRHLGKRWLAVLLPIAAASLALAVAAIFFAPTAGFYLLPTRVWEFMLGASLSLRAPRAPSRAFVREAVGLCGMALLAAGFFALDENDPFPGYNALLPCVGTCLLIYAGQKLEVGETRSIATRLLEFPPLVWIGLISYSLYLVHWPINAFTRYVTLEQFQPATTAVMTIASLALATLLWKFVEQPFRRPSVLTRRRTIFSASAAAIASVCVFSVIGLAGHGFPGRFPSYAEQETPRGDWGAGSCFLEINDRIEAWDADRCTRSHGFPTKVLLWGDSFAAHYVPGLEPNTSELQGDVIQYTFAGCPPILSYFSYARSRCTAFNARALTLIRDLGIKDVVLGARWTEYEKRGFEGLQQTIDVLRAMNVRVFVIGQSPQFIIDVQKLAFLSRTREGDRTGGPLAIDPRINARLQAFTKGATFIDPLRFLCRSELCPYRNNEGMTYFDFGHLSVAGAKQAVAEYWPRFGEPQPVDGLAGARRP